MRDATRENDALSLVGPRRETDRESANVTRVCVACSTGNTIYTMQIKHARAAHIGTRSRSSTYYYCFCYYMYTVLRSLVDRFTDEEIVIALIDNQPILSSRICLSR